MIEQCQTNNCCWQKGLWKSFNQLSFEDKQAHLQQQMQHEQQPQLQPMTVPPTNNTTNITQMPTSLVVLPLGTRMEAQNASNQTKSFVQFDKPIVFSCINFLFWWLNVSFIQLDVASCSSILGCSTQQHYRNNSCFI